MGITYNSTKGGPLSHTDLDNNWASFDTPADLLPTWASSRLGVIGHKVWHKLIETPANVFLQYPSATFSTIVEVAPYYSSILALTDGVAPAVQNIPIPIYSDAGLAVVFDSEETIAFSTEEKGTFDFPGVTEVDMLRLTLSITNLGTTGYTSIIPTASTTTSVKWVGPDAYSIVGIGTPVMVTDENGIVDVYNSPVASVTSSIPFEQELQPFNDASCIASYRFINNVTNDINGAIGFGGTTQFVQHSSLIYAGGWAFECIGTKGATWNEASLLTGLSSCSIVVGFHYSENRLFQDVGGVDVGAIFTILDGVFDCSYRFVMTETIVNVPNPGDTIVIVDDYMPCQPTSIDLPVGMTGTSPITGAPYMSNDEGNTVFQYEDLGGGQVKVDVYVRGVLKATGTGTGTLPTDILLNPLNNRTLTAYAIDYLKVFNRLLTPQEMKNLAKGLHTSKTLDTTSRGYTVAPQYFSATNLPHVLNANVSGEDMGNFSFNAVKQLWEVEYYNFPTTDFSVFISDTNSGLGIPIVEPTDGVYKLEKFKV